MERKRSKWWVHNFKERLMQRGSDWKYTFRILINAGLNPTRFISAGLTFANSANICKKKSRK